MRAVIAGAPDPLPSSAGRPLSQNRPDARPDALPAPQREQTGAAPSSVTRPAPQSSASGSAALPSASAAPASVASTRSSSRAGRPEPASAHTPVQTPVHSWSAGFKAPWPAFAAKTQAGRALVWTYPEAALDLSGQSDQAGPERGALIRKLIGALKLPGGSSNFWPHSSRPGQADPDEQDYFLRGVKHLSPKYVLVFGPESLAAIHPETGYEPYKFVSLYGRLYLLLPPLEALAADSEFTACLEFLSKFTKSLQQRGG